MTNCEDIGLELPLYARGRATEESTGEIERHLGQCESCQVELKELLALETLLQENLEEIELSPTFASTFVNRLTAEVLAEEAAAERKGWLGLRLPTWLVPVSAAAILAGIILGGGGLSGLPGSSSSSVPRMAASVSPTLDEGELLLTEPPADLYVWPESDAYGRPFEPPFATARFEAVFGGVPFHLEVPVEFRTADPAYGEVRSEPAIVPAVSVEFDPARQVKALPSGSSTVELSLLARNLSVRPQQGTLVIHDRLRPDWVLQRAEIGIDSEPSEQLSHHSLGIRSDLFEKDDTKLRQVKEFQPALQVSGVSALVQIAGVLPRSILKSVKGWGQPPPSELVAVL